MGGYICIVLYSLQSAFTHIHSGAAIDGAPTAYQVLGPGIVYNSSNSHYHVQKEAFAVSIYRAGNRGSQSLNEPLLNVQAPGFELSF